MRMKRLKKVAVMLVAVLALGLFGGCGISFDASAYIKALLDNSYKNDSAEFVAQKVGSAEEASTLYEQGIESELTALLAGNTVSDELKDEYRQVLKDIFKAVKYTVGDAEKQDDGSYIVTVNYEQMQIFGAAMDSYMTKVEDMTNEWTQAEEIPSDEEMYEQIYATLKDCLKDALSNATYADEASATIRVEIVDNTYTPNADDIANLESVMFDLDAVN